MHVKVNPWEDEVYKNNHCWLEMSLFHLNLFICRCQIHGFLSGQAHLDEEIRAWKWKSLVRKKSQVTAKSVIDFRYLYKPCI